MTLQVYLLGEFRVFQDEAQLPLPSFRTHSLLVALILRPRLQRREQLLGLLFPDLPERVGEDV